MPEGRRRKRNGQSSQGSGICEICQNAENGFDHKNTETHKFNFALMELKKYKKPLSCDRHGIKTTVTTPNIITGKALPIESSEKGQYSSTLNEVEMVSQGNIVVHKFQIKNITKNVIYMTSFLILHPNRNFQIIREHVGSYLQLNPGATYDVELKLKATNISVYKMPIIFNFQVGEDKKLMFTLIKEMVINILNFSGGFDTTIESPFKNKPWVGVIVYPPTRFIKERKFHIPVEMRMSFCYGLEPRRCRTQRDEFYCISILKLMEPGYLTRYNFSHFFRNLLWLEEIGAEVGIQKYNMVNVSLTLVEENKVELEVHGLEEKRPSLVKDDVVDLRLVDDTKAYRGFVVKVKSKSIIIGNLQDSFLRIIKSNPDLKYEVKFNVGTLQLERMHNAVHLCNNNFYLNLLFPDYNNWNRYAHGFEPLEDNQFKNKLICDNQMQKCAVEKIFNNMSCPFPYLVDGPPGTGKTETIIEAIYQIATKKPSSRILVCAPANSACEMITIKLAKYFSCEELVRIMSQTASWDSSENDMKKYYNKNHMKAEQLAKYRIIVSTLTLVGKYWESLHMTHVFIDEAAQAMEPEALIAIGGVLTVNGQLVLCGDPLQLGPICCSKCAENKGLGLSLMKRLSKISMYEDRNPDFLTRLVINYRSHTDILKLPNELFYNDELVPVSEYAARDNINKVVILGRAKQIKPSALTFHGVMGEERRDGKSPSYYNVAELNVVESYLETLMGGISGVEQVKATDIGIIAPYQRQIQRIHYILNKYEAWKGIEVGSVESFQGKEKRIIIISTVRSKASLLLPDKMYKLGFVGNKERFNVALTRAKSKVIIIGNPHILSYDENWLKYIQLCQSMGSYQGCAFYYRDEILRKDIMERVRNVKLIDDQYKNSQQNN